MVEVLDEDGDEEWDVTIIFAGYKLKCLKQWDNYYWCA